MKLPRWRHSFTAAIIILLMLVLPAFNLSHQYLHLLNMVFIEIILALGMYSLWSVGYINAAHPAFWGMGAYTAALLMMHAGFSFWLALPIAGIVPAIIAAIIGFPGLRVRGAYFLILTLALCELTRWVFTSQKDLFGGATGLSPIPQPATIHILGVTIDFTASLVPYYYLTLILCLITAFVYYRIHRSRVDRVWRSIAQNEELVASVGISVFWQKQISLITSCFFAGLAGAVYAPFMNTISPGQFSLWRGITIFLGVLVGGVGNPLGPIVGTFFMNGLSQILRGFKIYEPLVWGVIFILAMLYLRTGIIGLPEVIRNRIGKKSADKKAIQSISQ